MTNEQFLKCNVPRKVSIMAEDPNPDYVIAYLSERTGIPYDYIKSNYEVRIHKVRQRIFIKGSYEDIAKIFYRLNMYGLEYESIQQSELRIDINQFFNKLK